MPSLWSSSKKKSKSSTSDKSIPKEIKESVKKGKAPKVPKSQHVQERTTELSKETVGVANPVFAPLGVEIRKHEDPIPPPPLPPKRHTRSNLDDLPIPATNGLDDIKSKGYKLRNVTYDTSASFNEPFAPSSAEAGWRTKTNPQVSESRKASTCATSRPPTLPVKKRSVAKVVKGVKVENDVQKFHVGQEEEKPRKYSNSEIVSSPDETFVGRRNFLDCQSDTFKSITSGKGSVRGFKNRVRDGVTTFIEQSENQLKARTFEEDRNKIIVYMTSSRIVRETYHSCNKARKILQTLLVDFEERDLFMNPVVQIELLEKKDVDYINRIPLPQIFVDNQCIGTAEELDKVNESGELRRILKDFKRLKGKTTCATCGGYRRVPCPACGGSKRSLQRDCLTDELRALRCVQCDASGLQDCSSCSRKRK